MKHFDLKKYLAENKLLNEEYDPNQDPEKKGSEAYKRESWKAQFGSMDGFDKAYPQYYNKHTDKEKFISPLRKSIVKVLDDAFMIAVKNNQSEEELDRSLKTITDIIDNIVLSTVRNKKKYYKFD